MYKTYYTLMSNLDLLRDATNKELLEGLKEINLKYKKNMKFKDKLICLIL